VSLVGYRLVALSADQMDKVADTAAELWANAKIWTVADVSDVLSLARQTLGGEIPEFAAMTVLDLSDINDDALMLLMAVDGHETYLAVKRPLHPFQAYNGEDTKDIVKFVLGGLIADRNSLCARFWRGL
jgi:hypothetical protein